MIKQLLETLKDGQDPYKFLAGFVLSKDVDKVTREERYRFKQAFYACFHNRGPDIIKNCLEDLRELDELPAVREHLKQKANKT